MIDADDVARAFDQFVYAESARPGSIFYDALSFGTIGFPEKHEAVLRFRLGVTEFFLSVHGAKPAAARPAEVA